MTAQADVKELRQKAAMPAKQAGGSTVQQFFEQNKESLQAILPKHMGPDRMLKVALHAIRTTPQLQEATTKSLFGAVVQLGELGLEPNTPLGHAYLVPFRNKKEGTTDVQVIIGYRGLIELARRSGQIHSISAHAVHEQDEFSVDLGTEDKITHRPYLEGERGNIIAFYAVAKLKDGGHQFEVMSKPQVDGVMVNTQSKGNYGPWKDHYEEMGRKTVIRRLAKYLPLSIEMATATELDGMAEAGKDQGLDSVLEGDWNVAGGPDAPAVEEPEAEEPDSGEGDSVPLAEAGGGQEAPPAEPETPAAEPQGITLDYVLGALRTAKTEDDLADYLDMGRGLPAEEFEQAKAVYRERLEQLQGKAAQGASAQTGSPQGGTGQGDPAKAKRMDPIMDPQRAITNDAIHCLICGKAYKTLTRHIKSAHTLTPEKYREAFDLPENYPMKAPGLEQGSQEGSGESQGGEGAGSEEPATGQDPGGEGQGLGERLAQARRQQREQQEGGEPSGESTEEPAGDDSQGGFPNLE